MQMPLLTLCNAYPNISAIRNAVETLLGDCCSCGRETLALCYMVDQP
jgi:hypothetical protein